MIEPEKYVLLAEDNEDDVTLTLRSFKRKRFPYKIVMVRDGQEALDHIFGAGTESRRITGRVPMLVLLDLNLPKVSGLEVLKRIRADPALKNVPVVMLSSSNREADQADARERGADLYIHKPITLIEFDRVADQIKNFVESPALPVREI